LHQDNSRTEVCVGGENSLSLEKKLQEYGEGIEYSLISQEQHTLPFLYPLRPCMLNPKELERRGYCFQLSVSAVCWPCVLC
jgi:hypothetical protein